MRHLASHPSLPLHLADAMLTASRGRRRRYALACTFPSCSSSAARRLARLPPAPPAPPATQRGLPPFVSPLPRAPRFKPTVRQFRPPVDGGSAPIECTATATTRSLGGRAVPVRGRGCIGPMHVRKGVEESGREEERVAFECGRDGRARAKKDEKAKPGRRRGRRRKQGRGGKREGIGQGGQGGSQKTEDGFCGREEERGRGVGEQNSADASGRKKRAGKRRARGAGARDGEKRERRGGEGKRRCAVARGGGGQNERQEPRGGTAGSEKTGGERGRNGPRRSSERGRSRGRVKVKKKKTRGRAGRMARMGVWWRGGRLPLLFALLRPPSAL